MNSPGGITVVVADRQPSFTKELCRFLTRQNDITVLGGALDGAQALSAVVAWRPDVLLLDVALPAAGGLEVLARVHARSPATKCLLLTDSSSVGSISTALENGAMGFVPRADSPGDRITKAIRAVHAGDIWVSRRALAQVLRHLLRPGAPARAPHAEAGDPLTGREEEIMGWLARGMTNKEIGRRMGISDLTVKTHLQHIFGKLGVKRRLQAVLHPEDRSGLAS